MPRHYHNDGQMSLYYSMINKRSSDDAKPDLRNPFSVFALGVSRIEKMSQTVLRPAVVFVIDVNGLLAFLAASRSRLVLATARRAAGSHEYGFPVFIFKEKHIPLGRDRQAVQPS